MKAQIKYEVICCHGKQHFVSVMCRFFEAFRSGYYDFVKRRNQPCKDAELVNAIRRCQ